MPYTFTWYDLSMKLKKRTFNALYILTLSLMGVGGLIFFYDYMFGLTSNAEEIRVAGHTSYICGILLFSFLMHRRRLDRIHENKKDPYSAEF